MNKILEPYQSNLIDARTFSLADTQTLTYSGVASNNLAVSNSVLSTQNVLQTINTGSSLLSSYTQNVGSNVNVLNGSLVTTTTTPSVYSGSRNTLPSDYVPSTDVVGAGNEKPTQKVYAYVQPDIIIILQNNNKILIIGGVVIIIIIILIVYFFIL